MIFGRLFGRVAMAIFSPTVNAGYNPVGVILILRALKVAMGFLTPLIP